MTLIVAFKTEGGIVMAGDKMVSYDGAKFNVKDPKVFRKGDFMCGYTTSFRMGQLLKYTWKPPEQKKDQTTENFIYNDVIKSIRKLFIDNGYGSKNDEGEGYGTFILCFKSRIFLIEDSLQALEYNDDVVCCGCGDIAARIAIKILKTYETDIGKLVDMTFENVSMNIPGVSREFDIIFS